MDISVFGLPLQISGFIAGLVGVFIQNMIVLEVGFLVHLVGDVLFYWQLKREGKI